MTAMTLLSFALTVLMLGLAGYAAAAVGEWLARK